MKLKNVVLALLTSALLIGCNQNKTNKEDDSYTPIVLEEEDILQKNGSYGGYFIEIGAGRSLSVNHHYEFSYESSHATDKSFTVLLATSANSLGKEKTLYAEISAVEGNEKYFAIDTKKVGDNVLLIYDADEMLVYRNVIHIRRPVTVDTLKESLYRVDKWVSSKEYQTYFGSWTLSFTQYRPQLVGALVGGDDYESDLTFEFIAEFDEDEDANPYEEATDAFSLYIETTSTNSLYTTLFSFLVGACLDVIYVYYDSGTEVHLLTILEPYDITNDVDEDID